MALSKEQKILNKFDRVLNLDYVISIEHNLDESQLKHIQNYTHSRSCGAEILKYRKPATLQLLYEMICECLSYGKTNTLEKFQSMYGDEIGLQKYEEANLGKAITLENMIKLYGEDEGQVRWKSYCDKQSYTNTFEYKQEKYGWTREQFNEYNTSRSVTRDNLIRRHGEEEGNKKFDLYCERQSYAGITREYFVEEYGEEIGMQKYVDMLIKKGRSDNPTSVTANNFFASLGIAIKYTGAIYEEPLYDYDFDKVCVYDYVNHDLKLCIEFNGVYWHMKPTMYSDTDINPTSKKIAKEIWEYDALKKKAFMKKYPDYRYITVWEDEAYINHTSSSKVINESYMQSLINNILETHLAA